MDGIRSGAIRIMIDRTWLPRTQHPDVTHIFNLDVPTMSKAICTGSAARREPGEGYGCVTGDGNRGAAHRLRAGLGIVLQCVRVHNGEVTSSGSVWADAGVAA